MGKKNKKDKKVAHKVLRYFHVTPRLRLLYSSRHTTKDMIWHNTRGLEEGTMRQLVDGTVLKDLDMKYPSFSSVVTTRVGPTPKARHRKV